MKKKLLAFLLLLCLCLTSCRINVESLLPDMETGDTAPIKENLSGKTTLATVSPAQPNQTFGVAYVYDGVLNPYETPYTLNQALSHLLYDSLFTIAENGLPINGLCKEMTTEDKVVYNLTIQQGVMFHNKLPLTADDVVYSLNKACRSSLYADRLSCIESVRAVSEDELQIKLSKAKGGLALLLDVPITSRNTESEYLYSKYALLGSGRYSIDLDVLEESEYTYLQYNNSWYDASSEKPAVCRIDLFTVSDKDELLRRCYNSDIDIISLSSDEKDRIVLHGEVEKRTMTGKNLYFIGFNRGLQSFSDPNARKAIDKLIDREELTERLGQEAFRGVYLPFRPENRASVYLKKAEATGTDNSLDEARALLRQAGFSAGYYKGNKYTLTLLACSDSDVSTQIATYLKDQLTAVGFHVEAIYCDYKKYISNLYQGKYALYVGITQPTEEYDMAYLAQPSALFAKLYAKVNGQGATEIPMSVSEEMQEALNEIRELTCTGPLYSRELSEKTTSLFETQMPIVPLCYNVETVYMRGSFVSGVKLTVWDIFYNIQTWAQPK